MITGTSTDMNFTFAQSYSLYRRPEKKVLAFWFRIFKQSRTCSMHRKKIARYKTVAGMSQWKIIGDPGVDRMILLECI